MNGCAKEKSLQLSKGKDKGLASGLSPTQSGLQWQKAGSLQLAQAVARGQGYQVLENTIISSFPTTHSNLT